VIEHVNLKWKGILVERNEPYRVRTGFVCLNPSAASMDTVSDSLALCGQLQRGSELSPRDPSAFGVTASNAFSLYCVASCLEGLCLRNSRFSSVTSGKFPASSLISN
jgi:hypothetical protein